MADAAKTAGVKLFVWSSLVSVTELSQGRLTAVVHFDDKHKIAEYIKSIGIPSTTVILGCFIESASLLPVVTQHRSISDICLPRLHQLPRTGLL